MQLLDHRLCYLLHCALFEKRRSQGCVEAIRCAWIREEVGGLSLTLLLLSVQLANDPGVLYMFGGWDGSNDLSDLWQFTVQTLQWECLSTDTSQEVGNVALCL